MVLWQTDGRMFFFVVASCCGLLWCDGIKQQACGNEDESWQVIERIDGGFVAGEKKPSHFPELRKDLSKAERLENFEILWKAIDRHYSFFDLKKIDWSKIRKRYHFLVKTATNDDEFYRVLVRLVNELKDFHSRPYNCPSDLPAFRPNVSTHKIEGKAVVTYVTEGSEADAKGLRRGAIITRVDGLSVAKKVEQFRALLHAHSSERAFQEGAYWRLLDGEQGSTVHVTFAPPGSRKTVEVDLRRDARMPWGQPWQYRTMSLPVKKGKFLWVGRHPSGLGYIRIVTFEGREEIANEFDHALETLKDTPGLIIDIRDNPGGRGASQPHIIGRLVAGAMTVATTFEKNGPGHQEFRHYVHRVAPTGDWQYRKPIALLTNAVTGSASDLFACQMRGTGRVVLVGTTTHGDLPGHNVFAVLPCGLVVRVSNSYVMDVSGRIIEVNGTVPEIHAELTVKDMMNGTDSVIARAVDALRETTSRNGPGCDGPAGVCRLPGRSSVTTDADRRDHETNPRYRQRMPLEFALTDSYGRDVRASDYRGVPILMVTGPCWCAHCQGDADLLPILEKRYRARGLQVIRVTCYDGSLPVWEFQKHYGLSFVQLLDPIREFDRRYNREGWPFLILVNREGEVVFRKNVETADFWPELASRLEAMLPERSPVETVQREGIFYMPDTVARSGETKKERRDDRFPSVACAEDGRVYVAFTTNRNGTQDVYLRVFDGKKWLADQPVAATEADEFDGAVVVDSQNRPWVAWTSDAGGPPYNIFAVCAADSSAGTSPIQLTHSPPKDGAMHARLAVDSHGRIWIVYYRWERISGKGTLVQDREGTLRSHQWDKEVYARYLEQDHWSDEIHMSPDDNVPTDDHTDPVVAPWNDGIVVGWSWDFHQKNSNRAYAGNKKSDQPSIFLRQVKPGTTFERARAVSGSNVDSRPTIAMASDGRVFCAWESVLRDRDTGSQTKMIATSVENLDRPEQPGIGVNATGLQKDVCTPCLAASPRGDVTLVWSELATTGVWILKQCQWDGKRNAWTNPRVLIEKGNPRFPSAAYSSDGQTLWIAYSVDKGNRREVTAIKRASGVGIR
ncbi:MAG: S41 family peptidase [Thermoguttaceae bacterium]